MTTADEILLEQARIQVATQDSALEALRTRATAVVTVSGVVGALFAPHFLMHSAGLGFAAMAAFIVCAGLASVILWPRRVAFAVPLGHLDVEWVDRYRSHPDAGPMFAVQTATTLLMAYRANQEALQTLTQRYGWEVAFFGLQLVLWALAVLVR